MWTQTVFWEETNSTVKKDVWQDPNKETPTCVWTWKGEEFLHSYFMADSVSNMCCVLLCFSGALKDGARPWLSYHVCLWLSFYKEGLTLARELHGSHQLPPTGKCPTPILLSSRYLMSQSNNAIAKWPKGGAKGIISALLQVLEKQTNFFRKSLCSHITSLRTV